MSIDQFAHNYTNAYKPKTPGNTWEYVEIISFVV